MTLNTTLGVQREPSGYYSPPNITELIKNFPHLISKYEDLYPISTGRNWGYGCNAPVADNSCVIDLQLCNRILFFDNYHGVVTLEPGVTYQQLYDYLETSGPTWLCPSHGGGPNTSVVGNIMERGYGLTPIGDHFSSLISLEALLKDGSLYKSPLAELNQHRLSQLFKYGIGPYTDGLFTQSGLGIVTQATIRLAKRPEHVEMFYYFIKDEIPLAKVIGSIKKLKHELGSFVGGFNLMNTERIISMTLDYPLDKIKSRSPLSINEIEKRKQELRLTNWGLTGAIYSPKKLTAKIKGLLKSELSEYKERSLFYSTTNLTYYKLAAKLFNKIGWTKYGKPLNTLEEAYEVLNGKPNNVALKLAYWKHENKNLILQENLDPTRDNCGLIWYAPLVEIEAQKVEQYIEFINQASEQFGFNALITLTTIDDLCFDSTVPILFNKADPNDTSRAMSYYNHLLLEGAKKGFFPYRLNIETQKQMKVRPDFLKLDFVSKHRYK